MTLQLTPYEQSLLAGDQGRAAQKALQILVALGTIYNAERLLPVASVQIAGVSYDNLGEAGLQWLSEMADGGGQAQTLATLNPAGMDIQNWPALGISPAFAANQQRVIDAFTRMGVVAACTCTPYLIGNLPRYGEHIAWAESSAVCYANSVIGARTNREGGPSALAAALTARTPAYGLHLEPNRRPSVTIVIEPSLGSALDFTALGQAIGQKLESAAPGLIPYLRGGLDPAEAGAASPASLEALKSFCASVATYAGLPLFHWEGLTPEAALYAPPADVLRVTADDLRLARAALSDARPDEIDFVSLGCPHLSIQEIARAAQLLRGKRVRKEFWLTTARPTKHIADQMGYTAIIEASGAKFAVDTCCVVAPIQGRFAALATDSAKACYYASSKNKFKTLLLTFDEVIQLAQETP